MPRREGLDPWAEGTDPVSETIVREEQIKPVRPAKPKMTPAQVRAITKGKAPGGVRMAGAFGKALPHAHKAEGFDRKAVIERCVRARWMFHGEAHGTYVTTPAGIEELARYAEYLDAVDAYKRDLKAWRAQQTRKPKNAA